jgi:hypothetical protein
MLYNTIQYSTTAAVWRHRFPASFEMQSICQDRLGTNASRNTLKTKEACFHTQELLLHDSLNKSKSSSGPFPVKRVPIGFADDVTAELYFPAGTNATSPPLQVVIVLPGFFYNTGVCGTKFPFSFRTFLRFRRMKRDDIMPRQARDKRKQTLNPTRKNIWFRFKL